MTVESGRLSLKGSGSVDVSGGAVTVSGSGLDISAGDGMKLAAGGDAEIKSEKLDLKAQVYIRGELLEDMIRRIAAGG